SSGPAHESVRPERLEAASSTGPTRARLPQRLAAGAAAGVCTFRARSPQKLLQVLFQGQPGLGPDDRLDDLAVPVDVERGDGPDVVLLRGAGALVDVQLDDRDLVTVLGGERLKDRCYKAAGPAPLGPEIHEHRLAALEHLLRKGLVGHASQIACHAGSFVCGR